jgi:endonuclease/exonuclease/phosphatase (EEP) superfamily protein YafD
MARTNSAAASLILAAASVLAAVLVHTGRVEPLASLWPFAVAPDLARPIAAASLVLALIAIARRTWASALATALAAVTAAAAPASVTRFAVPEAAAGDIVLKVVSANVHYSREALTRLAGLAGAYDADLVAVYEAPKLPPGDFLALFPDASNTRLVERTREGRWLSSPPLIVSKRPLTRFTIDGVSGERAVVEAALPVGAAQVAVVAAHPFSPSGPAELSARNAMLALLAARIDPGRPFIVMGDFNATPWSAPFAAFPGTRAGDPRLEATWPAMLPLLGLPIDHILFGGGLALVDYRVGPDIGSDHLPLFAAFALQPGAAPLASPAAARD